MIPDLSPEELMHCEDAPPGVGGTHSDKWYDGGECLWCGQIGPENWGDEDE